MNRIMNYQDIHASDIDSWKSFREKYQLGDFAGAQAIAQTLTNTQINAQALNDLFNFIVETEQLSDSTFKSDVIQVSTTAPSNLQVGQMYFKEYNTPTPGPLPAGYTQVKYLQSSGTQYIDTGFKPNQNTAIMIDLDLDGSFSQYCSPFGARDGNTARFQAYTNNVYATWSACYATVQKSISKAITGRRNISLNKNTFSVDEASATFASASFQLQYNMWIFATNNSGTAQYLCKAKIYSAQIYDDGVLIRNFVPARNASGTLGLYDTVNGTFYTNAGSGAFVAGADVF